MNSLTSAAFRPLVVGPPRSGFTLLSSVLVHLAKRAPSKWADDLRQRAVNAIADTLGWTVSDAVVAVIEESKLADRLVYNRNFRELTGGPKWISPTDPDRAYFRKYIGLRGGGDLNLITSHPRAVLDHDTVVHSHANPAFWLAHPGYAGYRKFASIRNPIGILNSSIFSINALTSEYIQRFLPPEEDQDALRQHLALYKMTDLTFFAGLASHLKRYLEEFLTVRNGYTVMRWEDLIDHPAPTIQAIGRAAGVPVTEAEATAIWAKLDHVNLTGAHKHNYRAGFGIVGNWRTWLTNHHLELIRKMGLGRAIAALGYDADETLDERAYTPFQRQVSEMIARGQIYDDYPDQDLFTFAFNKSNIDIEKFNFRRPPPRPHTQIERSCFADERLEQRISDAAEEACARLNAFLDDLLGGDFATVDATAATVERVFAAHEGAFRAQDHGRFNEAQAACLALLRPAEHEPAPQPRLVRSVGTYNIVAYGQRFFALPQSLGPVDLTQDSVEGREGVVVAEDLAVLEQRLPSPERVTRWGFFRRLRARR